ncbi:MAG: sigma-70 family RNA polymerase sigma factor [Bacteroidota bacterium]
MNNSDKPDSEDKLLTALRVGDNLAFRQVYRQGYSLIENLIAKNGGSPEDAQDVFQEVLFIVVKKLREPDFRLTCALNTFLYAIARRTWQDRLRKKKPNVELKDTLHDFTDPAEAEIGAKKLFEKRHELVSQLLEQLSERCRQLLVSYYFEKKSMREIGQAMQIVEDGVRVQKHRCMSHLKSKLEAHPDYHHLINDEP